MQKKDAIEFKRLKINYLLLSVAFAELAQSLEKVDLDLAKDNKMPLDKEKK